MVFTRNLEDGGERVGEGVDAVSDAFGNVLVDQQHGNIFPLLGEVLEGLLDRRRFGLGVNDKEIPLGVRAICDVTDTREQETGNGVFIADDGEELPFLGCRGELVISPCPR